MTSRSVCCALLVCFAAACSPAKVDLEQNSAPATLRVILIPADGGTEDGTRADFQPVFDAVAKISGLTFDLKVGQSYNAVVEAMCSGAADVAFMGPVSYVQARDRGCARLLAVSVEKGKSEYFAGLFASSASGIATIDDFRGKRMAFGDVNSTSSFIVPVAMLMRSGIDPATDLSGIRLTGTHANAVGALTEDEVDGAALSLTSYEKAVNQGAVDPERIVLVARSVALPNPPIAMRATLSEATKAKLKVGFAAVSSAPGLAPSTLRGYGGKPVDGYDVTFPESRFQIAVDMMKQVDGAVQAAIVDKASQP